MKDIDQRLDALFEAVRNHEPEVPFEMVASRFIDTYAIGGGAFSQAWIGKLLFVAGAITVTSLLILSLEEDVNSIQMTKAQISHPRPVDKEWTFAIHKIQMENEVDPVLLDQEEKQLASSLAQNKPIEQGTDEFLINEDKASNSSVGNLKPLITGRKPIIQTRPEQFSNSPIAPSNAQRLVTITEMTTMEELEKIQALAKEVGVDFHFHVRHHSHIHKDNDPRNPSIPLIRDLRGYVAIESSEIIDAYKVRVPKRGKFKLNFGWYLDGEGKAFKLANFLVEKDNQTKHPKD